MRRFWRFKQQRTTSTGIPLPKVQCRLVTEPKSKAADLNTQFNRAFSAGNPYTRDQFTATCKTSNTKDKYPAMDAITITAPGGETLLQGLNPAKAADPEFQFTLRNIQLKLEFQFILV